MGINVHYIKADRNGSELIYKRSSFMLPEIIYKVDMNTFKKTVFKQSVVKEFNMSNFEINQAFVPSKDNTVHIPMFIVHKKGLKLDGSAPTLLYAYGGFGSSMMPSYSALQIFFINKLNGIYVLVNARGGGEYGDDWRMAAIKTTKQKTFDDIISAAEYLIKNNYTRRERLAIKGESNGGLTMAASANKRPDLFGAVIAGVGVMDMLRFWNFTVGYTWMTEYGDPIRNETEFRYIYRYSPLHAMPNKTSIYPATLALTADHDDRVVPAHSYKYIAQLQHQLGAQVPQTPLMIRVDTDSGHGAGKPTSKSIQEYVDIISFLINSLKLDYNISK